MYDNQPKKSEYSPQVGKGRIIANRKRTSDKSPQWKGELNHEGTIIKFGVWENETQYGKMFSLKVDAPWSPEIEHNKQWPKDVTEKARQPRTSSGIKDDEIPF